MAAVLRLANVGQTTTVDLLGGALKLRAGGWQTRTPTQENQVQASRFGATASFQHYNMVTETFDLMGQGSNAALRTAINALEALQEQTRRWHSDPLVDESVWLEWNTDGENAKRSLIYEIGLQYPASRGVTPLLPFGALAVQLAVTRHPLWENVTADTYSAIGLAALGGTWTPTVGASVRGTAPGRIATCSVYGSGDTYTLDKFWIGIREPRFGTAGFVSRWECENGTVGTDTVKRKDAGEGASPSDTPTYNKVRVTYVTTALAKRLSITVNDVCASNWLHEAGRYVVLARCKVSGGTSAVQLRYGANQAPESGFAANESVYVSNTAWGLVSLGEVQIPPVGTRNNTYQTADVRYTELQLWAEQIGGAGTWLDLDCLALIPAEHYVAASGAEINYSPAGTGAHVYVAENDVITGYAEDTSNYARRALENLTPRDWYFPVDGGMIVAAAERSTGSVLADVLNLSLSLRGRWLSYRSS